MTPEELVEELSTAYGKPWTRVDHVDDAVGDTYVLEHGDLLLSPAAYWFAAHHLQGRARVADEEEQKAHMLCEVDGCGLYLASAISLEMARK